MRTRRRSVPITRLIR